MTELDRSNIAMRFPWLTDLVFFRTDVSVRGINRWTGGQEREMSIPRRAVVHEGIQARVSRQIRRLEHDVAPSCVAYEIVTERCDGTIAILNKCLLCIVGENSVLQKRLRCRRTGDNSTKTRKETTHCILSQRAIRQT